MWLKNDVCRFLCGQVGGSAEEQAGAAMPPWALGLVLCVYDVWWFLCGQVGGSDEEQAGAAMPPWALGLVLCVYDVWWFLCGQVGGSAEEQAGSAMPAWALGLVLCVCILCLIIVIVLGAMIKYRRSVPVVARSSTDG